MSLLVLFVLASLDFTLGHICLLHPPQRGPLDISTSGNPTCFRHGEPCGGQAPQEPKFTFTSGSQVFIKFQQNYNHYSVGYPGYMDIGIAENENRTDFKLLAVNSDWYSYTQDSQRNYTILVALPSMTCNHCVIRVRYNAHKPGESPFIQCTDIKITSNQGKQLLQLPPLSTGMTHLHRAQSLIEGTMHNRSKQAGVDNLFGLMYNPNQPGNVTYVSVNASTGKIQNLNVLNFGLGFSKNIKNNKFGIQTNFIVDGIVTVDVSRSFTLMINHNGPLLDSPATTILGLRTTDGILMKKDSVINFDGHSFSALVLESSGQYLTFSIEENPQKRGTFFFVVGRLVSSGTWSEVCRTATAENTFINFQWAEYDFSLRHLYVLLGNENDADGLSARIYTFDINASKFLSFANLDVSVFTFMSIQLDTTTGKLLAISPGLFKNTKYPGYSLIEVDPVSGTVIEVVNIAPGGIFEHYYGGTIFNSIQRSTLSYVLRVAESDVDVIATIDLQTFSTTFSELTNLRHIHNLARGAI